MARRLAYGESARPSCNYKNCVSRPLKIKRANKSLNVSVFFKRKVKKHKWRFSGTEIKKNAQILSDT